MNIDLISGQIAKIHITLDTEEPYELYGGTTRGAFSFEHDGETWHVTAREEAVAGVPLCNYDIYAREMSTGREWVILSGKIVVKPRTASVPADKLHPVEYFITVPVKNAQVDAAGNVIVQGIPGPKGEKGDKGASGLSAYEIAVQNGFDGSEKEWLDSFQRGEQGPAGPAGPQGPQGEDGMTEAERALLNGAAQRDADNTFTAGNTFTGAVDMSTAQVTPPEGWNVGELTPEAIKQVVPMAWDSQLPFFYASARGYDATALGKGTNASGDYSAAFVMFATASGSHALAAGIRADAQGVHSLAIGSYAKSKADNSICLGAEFTETVNGQNVTHTCTTEGTGSITIGAGANTLNNGTTESSNSVTIGCKALNQGADSVVIGASGSNTRANNVAIGAAVKVTGMDSVAIGKEATAADWRTVAVGQKSTASGTWSSAFGSYSLATAQNATALGMGARATAKNATAVGYYATAADVGAMVFRSESTDGTYTQLYFSGANTPLANTYEGGEAMMGYVVRDSAGNIMTDAEGNAMVGTQKLSVLFPNNRGENAFTPAMLGLDDEWTPKPMFRPSDLDMPQEEPTEPEEYTPLPVYPIVEPEIEPLTE